jgi:hypothetical protein
VATVDEVWVLLEGTTSAFSANKAVLGIYSNEEAAQKDASTSRFYTVEKWAVDDQAVIDD